MMSFWRSVGGAIEIGMTAAEPEKALTTIAQSGIELLEIVHDSALECSFTIRRRDYNRISGLCKQNGYTLTIKREKGIYYALRNLYKRKILIIGMLILLIGVFMLPTRILFIHIEGNHTIPSGYILSAAEGIGIRFGASRRKVRSEKIKNALLDAIPELQWAGVNTNGCTATISVRERAISLDTKEQNKVTSVVADRDGYILSCVVTQGSAMVQPGQVVQKGQTLISGYSEHGLTIQATRAKGEVIAQTNRTLTVVSPVQCQRRMDKTSTTRGLSLLLGKKRIFFWKGSGISDAGCGRMYRQYDFTLPGGFTLPIALCVDLIQHYTLTDVESNTDSLGVFARQYLKEQMIAGQILSGVQTISRHADVLCLQGKYVCTEAIGREKSEQIGEANGETNGENR